MHKQAWALNNDESCQRINCDIEFSCSEAITSYVYVTQIFGLKCKNLSQALWIQFDKHSQCEADDLTIHSENKNYEKY